MAARICTEPNCPRPHRARGLCSTHYNQNRYTREQRHASVTTPCVVCGRGLQRRVDRARQACCSVQCRTVLQFGGATIDGYDWATDAMARARKAGAPTVERVERDEVLDRDGRRCYICDVDTTIATSPFDPRSATVDHVIPLSNGGAHALGNLRCACLGCNSAKGAKAPLAAPYAA